MAPQALKVPGSEKAAASPIRTGARLLPMPSGLFALRLAPGRIAVGNAERATMPAVWVCARPGAPELDIVDLTGSDAAWLVGSQRLFAMVPSGGTVAMLTGYRADDGDSQPLDVEIRRLDRWQSGADRRPAPSVGRDGVDLILGLAAEDKAVAVEATAFLRGEGELNFVESDWIGRLGTGCWVESFSLLPGEGLPSIEYKALMADGQETAWIDTGASCGVPGVNAPVIGFAVRQRPGSGPRQIDCEYSGAFQSGVVTGPARNGAPCLSPGANDPLEGLRVRLIPRPGLERG